MSSAPHTDTCSLHPQGMFPISLLESWVDPQVEVTTACSLKALLRERKRGVGYPASGKQAMAWRRASGRSCSPVLPLVGNAH